MGIQAIGDKGGDEEDETMVREGPQTEGDQRIGRGKGQILDQD